ncbi:MAG: hypothetical protein V1855_04340 [bacterium]
MVDVKKIYHNIKPEYVKNKNGKITNVCLDIKTYKAIIEACKEWEAIQKKEKVRWARIT